MSVDYDVSQSFKRIENELIESMVRNFKRHRVDEAREGFTWEQWQVLQLKELEKYRLANPKKFQGDFSEINQKVEDALKTTYTDAKSAEEAKILEQIKKGKIRQTRGSGAIAGKFFGVNAGRIEHLIEATKADFGRGEWAILRQANDQYRKIIFNAQMYSATGATYEQAVDMATKDFLKAGIQSITYKNGARHTMADYSRMALKTGQKRAYLMGEGDVHDKYGIHTVRVNKRVDACPLCVKWLGKVLVDDVYAGGTAEEAQKAGVPLLSEAIDEGFLHPNCKDVYSMYIEGVSTPADPWSKKELKDIADKYNKEQALQRAEDMQASYERMAKNSLDKMNVQRYQARADAWGARAEQIRTGAPPTPIIPAEQPKTSKPSDLTTALSECTTVDEVETLMQQQGWFYVNGKGYDGNTLVSLAGSDIDGAKAIFEAHRMVFDKFPQLKGKLTPPRVNKLGARTYGQCYMGLGRGGLSLNSRYFGSYSKLVKSYESDLKIGFHPLGTDPMSIVVHELGHAIDDYLTHTAKVTGNRKKWASAELRPKVARALKIKVKDFRTEVSEYATKNSREWWAESFAEYICSKSPRRASAEFGRMFEEMIKAVK